MRIASVNPSTGETLQEFDAASTAEVDVAMTTARTAQRDWAAESTEHRLDVLRRLTLVIQSEFEPLLDIIQTETGRMRPDAEAELLDVSDAIPYYINQLETLPRLIDVKIDESAFPDTDLTLSYAPHGVIALIMPWNFPFYLPMMTTIAALLTGNAVILKPSEFSTMVALKINELFEAAGLPSGLFQVLPGADDSGRALVDGRPDKIFFVGSVVTGKEIIARSGVTPVQVELGGNSAALVLADADLDLAANGIAWAATYHAGQDCAGIKRVFVHESVADEFVNKVKMVLDGLRPGIDYGPYITGEARADVKSRIDDAVNAGAVLITGGDVQPSTPGFWMTPSILMVADQRTDLVAKETFGNVIPVQVVKSSQDAINEANNTEFGLSAAIFSRDVEAARLIANEILSGMVFINDPFINLPGGDHWTGWRQSGFGTMESKLEQCLRRKVIGANRGGHTRPFWYPY